MKWVLRILQGILVVVFIMAGSGKMLGNEEVISDLTATFGYAEWFFYAVGTVEVMAAVGLIIGIGMQKLLLCLQVF